MKNLRKIKLKSCMLLLTFVFVKVCSGIFAISNTTNGSTLDFFSAFPGTIAVSGTAVTGTSTTFNTNFTANDLIYASTTTSGITTYRLVGTISSIASATSITLTGSPGWTVPSGAQYFIYNPSTANTFSAATTSGNNTTCTISIGSMTIQDASGNSTKLTIPASITLGNAGGTSRLGAFTHSNSSIILEARTLTLAAGTTGSVTLNSSAKMLFGVNTTAGYSNKSPFSITGAGSISFSGGYQIVSGTYDNISVDGGTSATSGALSISATGSLVTASGATLNMGSNTLTLVGSTTTLTNGGTITTSAATAFTDSRTTKTFGGTVNYVNGGQTIAIGNYNNLTLSNSSGVQSLAGNITISGTLTVNSGGKLNLNGFSIPAVNAFSGTGQITGGSTCRIYITGSSAGTFYMDQTTNLTTNVLDYLGLAANATATLGNTLVIYADTSYSGNLDLRSGSVLTSNTVGTNAALLQLKYNITSDLHAVVGMNGGSLVGEAMVEDYFVSGFRAYRQTGHTLDSALSINQITDDFDLFGIMGSGANSGRGSSGNRDGIFQATTTAKNSIFTYKEDVASGSKWIPFTVSTSTNSTIPVGKSIMFVMRPTGSGESGNYAAQLMDYEGQLNMRRNAVSVVKGSSGTVGYNLLSNPYAAYLNFDRFIDTNSAILANLGFYKYDKSSKNYITHGKSGSQWVKNGSNFTVNTANIDPGDAIWVRVSSAGNVFFNPSMTALSKSPDVSKGNKMEVDSTYYTTLNLKLTSKSDSTLADFATIVTSSWGGDMKYQPGDMSNMMGTCIDVSVVAANDENLAIKTIGRERNWLIPLNLQVCSEGDYGFQFAVEENKPGNGTEYELLDKYLNKSYKLINGQRLSFSVNADPNSKGVGRFFINSIAQNVSSNSIVNLPTITIFPNPVKSNGEIMISNQDVAVEKVELLNSMGQAIYTIPEQRLSDKLWSINLAHLPVQQGVCLLRFTYANKTITQKIILN